MSTSIATVSGAYVNPFDLIPSDIDTQVIIHSLSMICRFNGHIRSFYSVAQHSVHVAERVRELTDDRNVILAALFHDASEAYLGDVTAPLKRSFHFTSYCILEHLVQDTIATALNIPGLDHAAQDLILRADLDLLALEAIQLGGWNLDAPEWNGLHSTFQRLIIPLPPKEARSLFRSFLTEIQYGV